MDTRISRLAVQLWRSDNCPDRPSSEYWEKARALIALDDSQPSPTMSYPRRDSGM
jgi:hypothetical protein